MMEVKTPFFCDCGNAIVVRNEMVYRFLLSGKRIDCDECHRAKNKALTMPYAEYLLTKQWKDKARQCRQYWGNRCALCYSDKDELHVHHRTYDRVRQELPTDLIALCKGCHEKFHGDDNVAEIPY